MGMLLISRLELVVDMVHDRLELQRKSLLAELVDLPLLKLSIHLLNLSLPDLVLFHTTVLRVLDNVEQLNELGREELDSFTNHPVLICIYIEPLLRASHCFLVNLAVIHRWRKIRWDDNETFTLVLKCTRTHG